MEQTSFTERLMEFGLTRQEASIYQCLLTEGKVTGYEVAKQTGISRSNAYNSLASMCLSRLTNSVRIVSVSWRNPENGCRNICRRRKRM